MRYPAILIDEIRELRSTGKTYNEIRMHVKISIPKSTLSYMCKNVSLPQEYRDRIALLSEKNLHNGRRVALVMGKIKRERFLKNIQDDNVTIAEHIRSKDTAKIALAMLCLGEASKSKGSASFYLGSSDPHIIILFLSLLKYCYSFDSRKVRCTVQCRADQDILILEEYWQTITKISKQFFYKTRIDPRTIGKPTLKKNYKGVLRVDYLDSKVRFELECLADLVYNRLITL